MREGSIDDTPQAQFKNQLRRLRVSHQTFVSSINGRTLWILINFRLLAHGFIESIRCIDFHCKAGWQPPYRHVQFCYWMHWMDSPHRCLKKKTRDEKTKKQIFYRFSINPIVFLYINIYIYIYIYYIYLNIYIYVYIFFLRANEWAHSDEWV